MVRYDLIGTHAMLKKPFVIREYVRWGDVDLAGIICYGAYLRFFELAETEIFRAAGLPFKDIFERYDIWLPRKVIHAEFHSPALLDERLEVITYFSRIGRSSLTINFDVVGADGESAGRLHAAAHQVLVCVSRKDFAVRPIPADIAAALDAYAMQSEEARTRKE